MQRGSTFPLNLNPPSFSHFHPHCFPSCTRPVAESTVCLCPCSGSTRLCHLLEAVTPSMTCPHDGTHVPLSKGLGWASLWSLPSCPLVENLTSLPLLFSGSWKIPRMGRDFEGSVCPALWLVLGGSTLPQVSRCFTAGEMEGLRRAKASVVSDFRCGVEPTAMKRLFSLQV